MRQLLFVVEDETRSRELAMYCLEDAGYSVRTFSTANVMAEAEEAQPALMLLSTTLPEGQGLDLYRRIRENHALANVLVIFLIPKDSERHRALALESGADDCITKPFSPSELVSRVHAVFHRSAHTARRPPTGMADLIIDSFAMKILVRGIEVPTTSLEFRLIEYLARHRGQVFTRDLLLDAVWGDMQFVTPRSVDACISRVREKIEPDSTTPTYLKTIRRVGYRLDAVAAWQLRPDEGCTCLACTSPPRSPRDGRTRARKKTLRQD
jgi:DNA-binding response OmpR family regulator